MADAIFLTLPSPTELRLEPGRERPASFLSVGRPDDWVGSQLMGSRRSSNWREGLNFHLRITVQMAAPPAIHEPATMRPTMADLGKNEPLGSWAWEVSVEEAVAVKTTVDRDAERVVWVAEVVVGAADELELELELEDDDEDEDEEDEDEDDELDCVLEVLEERVDCWPAGVDWLWDDVEERLGVELVEDELGSGSAGSGAAPMGTMSP